MGGAGVQDDASLIQEPAGKLENHPAEPQGSYTILGILEICIGFLVKHKSDTPEQPVYFGNPEKLSIRRVDFAASRNGIHGPCIMGNMLSI